ncbi:hypothetical protein FQN54_003522 [Arachnomyces sp. PD_36]|nr:hypothetical protein FQN54_003522 [Arachnomyces sp. PD_36]
MTYCTPYLLQLGLTKSRTSLVWIAGPLSGLIMQPIVGVIADRSRSKWGRRRPFMVGGSLVVGVCLLVLGWTSEIVGIFMDESERKKSVTIAAAVVTIYAVDFAINVVQACCRSLIVDTLPISQQQLGSAWASRMTAIGHLVGYAIGSIDMVNVFGTWLGDTQFKQVTLISAFTDSDKKVGAIKILKQLFRTTLDLPPRIRAICWAQFWCWIGWFPFLFYSTTWVGETYFRYEAPESAAEESTDILGDVGRMGSLSLVIFSVITFASSVFLPFAIRSPDEKKSTFNRRQSPRMKKFLARFPNIQPDLQVAWMISHLVFAATMIFAPLAKSVSFATFLVAICGVPWAISCWAPFSFMGVEINRLTVSSSGTASVTSARSTASSRHGHYRSVDTVEMNGDLELDNRAPPSVLRLNHQEDIEDSDDDSSDSDGPKNIETSSTGELAGIYLGVLNVYTTLPQFVGTFISWIVFSILDHSSSPPNPEEEGGSKKIQTDDGEWMDLNAEGPNAISVCLFIGALSALVSAEMTRRLRYVK